ncbi:M3 family metallopeptidase [Gallionella capsiferriformans]|uniref:oligopeptidase A n=1 Tax=Gallionella capsiferriformans (strain ES-2) TaxID=395494 RepID=D9SIC7_GALCS|nr:M3 family metallopeptidase [Gallionella capsiferriformans]ADL54184.1 Oligopeptidase A [Gallionella capsiferriformans ES-2]
MNPLLDFSGLPRFAEIQPEQVAPAIETLLGECRELTARLLAESSEPDWDNFVAPMEDAHERLSRAWGPVGHLNAVMNSPELREAYNATLPVMTQYYAELGQNLALFNKFKALRSSAAFAGLSVARQKIIENELRDFRLGGAELPEDKKARYLEIQERQSELSSRFSDNLLDATNDFTLLIENKDELSGLPEDVLQAASDAASAQDKPGWLFTLKAPSYMPVMQFADNRELRAKLYRAYATRASEFGNPSWDNSALMDEIVQLRGEEARLLGFANYGELSLAAKMAQTPAQVVEFMRELAQRSRPFAEKDLTELRQFAAKELGLAELHSWDVTYASEKLREQRYAFSEQEVKEYFPEDAVLKGLFSLVETLYGLHIVASIAPVWHESVHFFDIRDAQGQLVGQFYFDLYARASKRGGAWMDDVITRRRVDGRIQTPVAYMNCNFAAPVGDKPAVFTHDDVITLFHEFGHGLHHLLTEVEDLGVSGINGVEWDAVELPSQFMENYCWEWEVLSGMTRHVETGAPLPRTLFDKMLAAKNFQSGLQSLRQIEFALFDMLMHSDFEAGGKKSILELLDEVRAEVALLIPPEFNRFPHSFSHIFAGGYGAGYYSYKWAEVLSADAYSLFEEQGVLNPAVGARFRAEVLAVGGSRPAMQSFAAFRGREPAIDALLRHNGLTEAA